MKPVDVHLSINAGTRRAPFDHLKKTLSHSQYRKAFITTGI